MAGRFVVCGMSSRGLNMFIEPLLSDPSLGEVVGVIDIDQRRFESWSRSRGVALPFGPPDAFDRMVAGLRPDGIIVTSPDASHVDYVLAGLRADLDVICEKPMVTDCAQARRVLDAEQSSAGSLRVTHNSRYRPPHMHIKRLISTGRIGRVVNVELAWNLDTYHGASYFWRWNRLRRMSGGLTITKACHHFDLVNWWLADAPARVFAFGARNYYGPDSPHNPSVRDGIRYSPEEQRARSPYAQRWGGNVVDDHLRGRGGLPYPVQYPDGNTMYIFDEEIDIEDTYSAVIRYRGGASVAYSLNASSPWEGYILAINGTHGRIETVHYTAPSRLPFEPPAHETVKLLPLFGDPEDWRFPLDAGGHGGSDERLRRDLFAPEDGADELGLRATGLQAAYAVAIGEAIWRSVADDGPVEIDELLRVPAGQGVAGS